MFDALHRGLVITDDDDDDVFEPDDGAPRPPVQPTPAHRVHLQRAEHEVVRNQRGRQLSPAQRVCDRQRPPSRRFFRRRRRKQVVAGAAPTLPVVTATTIDASSSFRWRHASGAAAQTWQRRHFSAGRIVVDADDVKRHRASHPDVVSAAAGSVVTQQPRTSGHAPASPDRAPAATLHPETFNSVTEAGVTFAEDRHTVTELRRVALLSPPEGGVHVRASDVIWRGDDTHDVERPVREAYQVVVNAGANAWNAVKSSRHSPPLVEQRRQPRRTERHTRASLKDVDAAAATAAASADAQVDVEPVESSGRRQEVEPPEVVVNTLWGLRRLNCSLHSGSEFFSAITK